MSHCLIRPLTFMLTGLAIISCSEEATAPTPAAEEPIGPSLATASAGWVTKANMPDPVRTGLTSAVVAEFRWAVHRLCDRWNRQQRWTGQQRAGLQYQHQ